MKKIFVTDCLEFSDNGIITLNDDDLTHIDTLDKELVIVRKDK